MYSITHSLMEMSPSWEAFNCAATAELPSILWNTEVDHRVHMTPPPVPILGQIDLIPTITTYPQRSILILSTLLRLGLPSCLFLYGFPTNILYAFLLSPICAECSAHLILLDLITLIMLGKKYKLWCSSGLSYYQVLTAAHNVWSPAVL
jgi:hypothetical protein